MCSLLWIYHHGQPPSHHPPPPLNNKPTSREERWRKYHGDIVLEAPPNGVVATTASDPYRGGIHDPSSSYY